MASGADSESVRLHATHGPRDNCSGRDYLPWPWRAIAGRADVWTPRGNYPSNSPSAQSLKSRFGWDML
jgi:hypothetical protein